MMIVSFSAALPAHQHLVLDPDDSWKLVYNNTESRCDVHDGADSMPAAFYNRRDNTTIFWAAVGTELHPSIGPSLNNLKHECSGGSIFNATQDQHPESYANFQWMQSVTAMPNGTVFALIHNEFHGWNVTNRSHYCSIEKSNSTHRLGDYCNMWSTGLGPVRLRLSLVSLLLLCLCPARS